MRMWLVLCCSLLSSSGCDDLKRMARGLLGGEEERRSSRDRSDEDEPEKPPPPPPPTTLEICEALSKAVGGQPCTRGTPGGIGEAATEKYEFALAQPKGEKCQVLRFEREVDLTATVAEFEKHKALAGPHRYTNTSQSIFVQCNSRMPAKSGSDIRYALSRF